MNSVKVFFTFLALGFGLSGFSQSVNVINNSNCDFDVLFADGVHGTGCTMSGGIPSFTVPANTSTTANPSQDELVYVEISSSTNTGCRIGIALAPDISAFDCKACTALATIPSRDVDKCQNCGRVTMTWTVDCETGIGTILIE